MQRVSKKNNSKRAFTLTEMVIVVGIIVIIASVVGFGVADMIKTAKDSNDAVAASSDNLKQHINDSEAVLLKYNF